MYTPRTEMSINKAFAEIRRRQRPLLEMKPPSELPSFLKDVDRPVYVLFVEGRPPSTKTEQYRKIERETPLTGDVLEIRKLTTPKVRARINAEIAEEARVLRELKAQQDANLERIEKRKILAEIERAEKQFDEETKPQSVTADSPSELIDELSLNELRSRLADAEKEITAESLEESQTEDAGGEA